MEQEKLPRPGQKQWPKTSARAFYLGDDEDKERRIANLTAIAKALSARGASTVVQIVADVPAEIMAEALRPLMVHYENTAKVED